MNKVIYLTLAWALLIGSAAGQEGPEDVRPNILWLSAEDIGPHLGCYGDPLAKTPNLDRLATQGMVYDVAWSNYPVCAPARTTLITGVYAASFAAGHMRCEQSTAKGTKMFPQFLREAGYFCTNNSKEDYNLTKPGRVWDLSNNQASYTRREKQQPFFSVFNHTGTHESKIRKRPHELRTDPSRIVVPPYHPDTPEVRKDWAQYYDNISTLDDWVGRKLKQLEDAKLADSTIVVFFGDHGSGMPRHKRYAGSSGMRVPLIVFVPEKLRHLATPDYQPGSHSRRPVGFVDFAPSMLSAAGIDVPSWMQGDAFLGVHAEDEPAFVYGFRSRMDERVDCSRSISDGRYLYIRNYMPHLPHGQYIAYQQQTPTTAIWNQMYRDGSLNEIQARFWSPKEPEEFYDLTTDPDETKNLVADSMDSLSEEHKQILNRLRDALAEKQSQVDAEMLPEPLTSGVSLAPPQDQTEREREKYRELVTAADHASNLADFEVSHFFDVLAERKEPGIRHWASMGILLRGESSINGHRSRLEKLLTDKQPTVRINIAETLALHGNQAERDAALAVLLAAADMNKTDYHSSIWALNSIARLDPKAESVKSVLGKLPRKPDGVKRGGDYVDRLIKSLLAK